MKVRTVTSILLLLVVPPHSRSLSSDRSDYEDSVAASSKSLTKELLNLDLGYNVLNNEMLRRNIGVSVDKIDEHAQSSPNSKFDSGEFSSDFEDELEELPSPARLIRDDDFNQGSGPSPTQFWSDEKFWGGRSPFFFPFGRPPPPRRPHGIHRGQNPKVFVGDQHQCGTGSCEFFLFCWMSGGLIEGSCGGFLFACCQRPDAGGPNSQAIVNKVSGANFFWSCSCVSFLLRD